MGQHTDSWEDGRMERRSRPELRNCFDAAYGLIEPFFDQAAGWGSRPLQHLASHVLRNNFPDLSGEDVHAAIVAAHRVYINRNPGDSDHLHRPEEIRRGS